MIAARLANATPTPMPAFVQALGVLDEGGGVSTAAAEADVAGKDVLEDAEVITADEEAEGGVQFEAKIFIVDDIPGQIASKRQSDMPGNDEVWKYE
ncbi:MAG: hypothetical protein LQ341_001865 [Variospora aurantia]|nr:MAG: hypothetical protein LQ341_001865 [Variospora aurantia]